MSINDCNQSSIASLNISTQGIYSTIRTLVTIAHQNNDAYFDLVKAIARLLPKGALEQLKQLVGGPVWDGDVISKLYRDELISLCLAVRVCNKGEQGYTAATNIAFSILKAGEQP